MVWAYAIRAFDEVDNILEVQIKMFIFKFRFFSLSMVLCFLALMPIGQAQAACPGSSPTAQAISQTDYEARAVLALGSAKAEAALKRPKSPYEGCIALTSIDWGSFSNLLSMDAIIQMIKDRMNSMLDSACTAARSATAMPGNIVNGVLQNGVSQINNIINTAPNVITTPINNAVSGTLGGAINLMGQYGSRVNNKAGGAVNNKAGGAANNIVNGIIP